MCQGVRNRAYASGDRSYRPPDTYPASVAGDSAEMRMGRACIGRFFLSRSSSYYTRQAYCLATGERGTPVAILYPTQLKLRQLKSPFVKTGKAIGMQQPEHACALAVVANKSSAGKAGVAAWTTNEGAEWNTLP